VAALLPDMQQLVERMGPHPATELQLDLSSESGQLAWWATAVVLAAAGSEARGLEASRRLLDRGIASPGALGGLVPAELAALLEELGERAPAVAARLVGSSRGLVERWGGSLGALSADCDDLEQLGGRLAGLAPGVGVASVLRFLRPLRDILPGADATPLAASARAAARHLGWISDGDDEEGPPAGLLYRWQESESGVAFRDVEAAAERLGARACLRERAHRCPLADSCPLRQ